MKYNNTTPAITTRILIFSAAAILGLSSLAFAGHGHHSGAWAMDTGDPKYQEMNKLHTAYTDKMAPLYQALRSNQALLQSELLKGQTDRDKIMGIQEDITEIRTQLDRFELDHTLEMKQLGPDYAGFCRNAGNHGWGHGMSHHQ